MLLPAFKEQLMFLRKSGTNLQSSQSLVAFQLPKMGYAVARLDALV
jgi:hypothetical protein